MKSLEQMARVSGFTHCFFLVSRLLLLQTPGVWLWAGGVEKDERSSAECAAKLVFATFGVIFYRFSGGFRWSLIGFSCLLFGCFFLFY